MRAAWGSLSNSVFRSTSFYACQRFQISSRVLFVRVWKFGVQLNHLRIAFGVHLKDHQPGDPQCAGYRVDCLFREWLNAALDATKAHVRQKRLSSGRTL